MPAYNYQENTENVVRANEITHKYIYMKRERMREVGGRRKVTFIRNVFLSVDGERESCTATKKKIYSQIAQCNRPNIVNHQREAPALGAIIKQIVENNAQ